jgi:hypothetical protein
MTHVINKFSKCFLCPLNTNGAGSVCTSTGHVGDGSIDARCTVCFLTTPREIDKCDQIQNFTVNFSEKKKQILHGKELGFVTLC